MPHFESTSSTGFFPGSRPASLRRRDHLQPAIDFRLDHGQVRPGDLTALDGFALASRFLELPGRWWPRSGRTMYAFQRVRQMLPWHRSATSSRWSTDFGRLGFIRRKRCRRQGRLRRGPARDDPGRRMSSDAPLDLDVLVIGAQSSRTVPAPFDLARSSAASRLAEQQVPGFPDRRTVRRRCGRVLAQSDRGRR